MADNVLELKNLRVKYELEEDTVEAVNGVNIQLKQGETLGLVGETGAGKTTTALSLLRLIDSPPGVMECDKMEICGEDVLGMNESELEHIRGTLVSMIFQDPMTSLNPVFTVGQQIAESLLRHEKVNHEEAWKKAEDMLELVGIPRERAIEYPHQFSGGMKQRVIIAIALACSPKLLIADEPTTALDVTIQAQVLAMIAELRSRLGTSMLMITHDLGIVARTCDDVCVMYAGKIVEAGTVEDIFLAPSHHPYTEGLFGSIPNLTTKARRLKPILGLMPDPTNLPKGCEFAPRCEKCMEICRTEKPKICGEGSHKLYCHLFDPDRQKTGVGGNTNG